MDNSNITINGVRYNLSRTDMGNLQAILARARVVKDTNAQWLTSIAKSSGERKEKVGMVSDRLTDDVVKGLIGHKNVVYYNCLENRWNTKAYDNNQKIDARAKEFKTVLEKVPEFRRQYEFVAPVTMTIDSKFYSGYGKSVRNPRYSGMGTAVVGNVIVRNKKTGTYELYGSAWVCVFEYNYSGEAVSDGAARFVNDCVGYPTFRKALLAAHTR